MIRNANRTQTLIATQELLFGSCVCQHTNYVIDRLRHAAAAAGCQACPALYQYAGKCTFVYCRCQQPSRRSPAAVSGSHLIEVQGLLGVDDAALGGEILRVAGVELCARVVDDV